MLEKVTGKTLVPISLLISLSGLGGWLMNLYATAQANAKAISKIETDLHTLQLDFIKYKIETNELILKSLSDINGRLISIEVQLKKL